MSRVSLIVLPFVLVLVVAVLLPTGTAASGAISQPPRIAPHGWELATSTNWSGYAVPKSSGAVSDVKGNWTVPTVKCSSGNQYSSIWVGIDGYNSGTVEQTGTEEDCVGASGKYYAWYEMYPAYPVNLSMAIHPGNQMYAEVKYNGSSSFTLTIKNLSTGVSFSVNKSSSSAKRSSAEWIVEAPSSLTVLPLANFGTAYLTNSKATISGVTGTISAFSGYTSITMVTSGGTVKAQPSGLSNGGANFNVVWKHR